MKETNDDIMRIVFEWEDDLEDVYGFLMDVHSEEKTLVNVDKKYQKVCVHDIASSLKICLNFISGNSLKNKKLYDGLYDKKCVPDIVAKHIEEHKEQQ